MAAILAGQLLIYQRNLRKQRVFRDRTAFMSEEELICRYRLNQASIFDWYWFLPILDCRSTRNKCALGVTFNPRRGPALVHCRHPQLAVSFPHTDEQITTAQTDFHTIRNFPQVIGCIDGTQIAIKTPAVNEHIYVCRKGYHSMNIQAVCDAKLRFTDIVVKYPGFAHDSFVLRTSSLHIVFENGQYPDCLLLGDSGYPLKKWLMMVPFLNPTSEGEKKYNSSFKTTRCTIERAFGVLKSRFRCLHHKSGGCLMYSTEPSVQC